MPAASAYGRRAEAASLSVMLVDDSIVARSILQGIIGGVPGLAVVATASSAEQAFAILDASPIDIVLLDLALPGIDGLTALPEIVRRGGGARVLVVSGAASAGAEACVRALTLGASDTIEKPRAGFTDDFRAAIVAKIMRISGDRSPRILPPLSVVEPGPLQPMRLRTAGPVACIAIGASTGGLHALSAFFRALPPSCRAPILVTQHLPADFMPFFASQLATIAARPTRVARDRDRLRAGEILVAPGDAHLGLRGEGGSVRVALDRAPAASGCLPSVDPMFAGVAECFGPRGFAVVLSGMGRDGTIGARAIVAAGGEIAAQDRRSSTVWGMPGAVAAAGLAATIAEPSQIAARAAERTGIRQ